MLKASTISGTWVGLAWLLAASTPLGVAEDPPRAFIDGVGPGWRTLGKATSPGQLRPRDLDVERGRRPLLGLAGRRAPIDEDLYQLRDGRPLAASEEWRKLRLLRLDAPEGARRAQARRPADRRDRGPGARPWLYRAVRAGIQEEGRLGLPPTATSSRSAPRR